MIAYEGKVYSYIHARHFVTNSKPYKACIEMGEDGENDIRLGMQAWC